MKQSLVMMVLLLISVLGLGKLALPFMIVPVEDKQLAEVALPNLAAVADSNNERMNQQVKVLGAENQGNTASSDKEMQALLEKPNVSFYESWSGEWLANELIPSVEAAEAMPLSEEARGSDEGTVKVAKLREMQRQLDTREKSLDEREGEAKKAELRAKDKIFELEQLETRIKDLLAQEKSIKDKKIKRLAAVYEGMKAEKAAPVVGQMNLGIVVKIFTRMSEKQVGKILSFLPPKKAVIISQALTERIGSMK